MWHAEILLWPVEKINNKTTIMKLKRKFTSHRAPRLRFLPSYVVHDWVPLVYVLTVHAEHKINGPISIDYVCRGKIYKLISQFCKFEEPALNQALA